MKAPAVEPIANRMNLFEKRLAGTAALLEPRLDELLPKDGRLAEAMRYAVLGAGKRFRPFLVLETAKLFDASQDSALRIAAAIECLHCYSLVHDDLPAMDDDDMRRGKPTVHKVFGEATAILAGDALQSLAFEILAQEETHPDPAIRSELILGLARAAGFAGMAGGQQLDIETHSDIEKMSAMKTGSLIRFSVVSGAILGGAKESERSALAEYGEALGLAFQISDDIQDAGKDSATAKRTFITTLGMTEAKRKLEAAVEKAIRAIKPFGHSANTLEAAAKYMLSRELVTATASRPKASPKIPQARKAT